MSTAFTTKLTEDRTVFSNVALSSHEPALLYVFGTGTQPLHTYMNEFDCDYVGWWPTGT